MERTTTCHLCNETCFLESETEPGKGVGRIAVKTVDGNVYCIPCHDVRTFAEMLETKTIKPKETEFKKTESTTMIFCPKCKTHFETKCSKCGFVNPLTRVPNPKKKKNKGKQR